LKGKSIKNKTHRARIRGAQVTGGCQVFANWDTPPRASFSAGDMAGDDDVEVIGAKGVTVCAWPTMPIAVFGAQSAHVPSRPHVMSRHWCTHPSAGQQGPAAFTIRLRRESVSSGQPNQGGLQAHLSELLLL
jgi:hypothetical protein